MTGDTSARTIFHVDMDAFFVSVEELSNPALRGLPVVVGGKPGERGVVAAASYAARKFGVHSAMPLREALRKCPQAIFLEGHPERYLSYSKLLGETFRRFSPLVSMASIDEAYLDLTGTRRLLGPPLAAAHNLHQAVQDETGLPCSIGVGTSRLVAKICSALAKPNGIMFVQPGTEPQALAPLEIGRVPGVGRATRERLAALGIRTIGDAARQGESFLQLHFGKAGLALAGKALGLDSGAWFSQPIGERSEPKSISHETTFPEDTLDPVLIDATIAKLTQLVARRLREHGLWAKTVQVKIRYSDFSTRTRASTLGEATQLDSALLLAARALYQRNRIRGKAVRLLGVHASSLQREPRAQPKLFAEDGGAKWARALQAVDSLRDRYGESAVGLAASLRHGRRERVHENPSGLAGRTKDGK